MLVVFMGIIKIMALICMSLIATKIFFSILILRGVLRYGNND